MAPTKPCVKCGGTERGKFGKCKPCNAEYMRAYYAANVDVRRGQINASAATRRDKTRKRNRRYQRLAYGIKDPDTYDIVLRAQNGICALCPAPATHCDHDHATGLVRGALCLKCNSGLGMLDDSIERLRRAIDYLTDPPTNRIQQATADRNFGPGR